MNSLSWLIYLAEVTHSLGWILGLVAFCGIIGGFCVAVGVAIDVDTSNWRRKDEEKLSAIASGWGAGKKFFIAALVAALISVPIPSKDTIYAIAASEIGEEVVKSNIGQKTAKAIEAWLDKQISDAPKGGSNGSRYKEGEFYE